MSDTYRSAYIYVRNVFAGVLAETDYGYSFAYNEEYLQTENATAVSLTLPLTANKYRAKTLLTFSDRLITEGWLLDIVKHNRNILPRDQLSVL